MKAARLARGKANYETNKFLENSETLEYMASLKKPEPKPEPKPKEVKKNAK